MNRREVEAVLAAREVGQLPVSIATSLALEGAFGIYPDRPAVRPAPILTYQDLWINLRTLMRNLLGALPSEVTDRFMPEYFAFALVQELQVIEAEVLRLSEGLTQTVCYISDHVDLRRVLPSAPLRVVKTPKQEFSDMLERRGIAMLLDALGGQVRQFRTELEGRQRKALILTHHPVDLLSRYNFRQLDLLESHTGLLKNSSQWYTKLSGGRDLPPLPFNKFTLTLFGDNNNLLVTQPLKLRRAVLEVAELDNWTAITTMDKIRHSLKKIEDPTVRASVQALLS